MVRSKAFIQGFLLLFKKVCRIPLPCTASASLYLPPAEQQCVVGSIASYDANAVANTCTEEGHLTVLTGTTTCDLGCAAGYFSSDIKGLTCTADGNAAVGTKNGGIECTGKGYTWYSTLSQSVCECARISINSYTN